MSRSLLEVLRNVTLDPSEHAAFSADPAGYLAQYGYEDVPAEDLAEAFSLVADTLPPDVAQTVSSSFGAEATAADPGGFGGEALASDGFAAGPSLDADPEETAFGAVTNDFDDDVEHLADEQAGGELDDLDADLGTGPPQAPADDLDELDPTTAYETAEPAEAAEVAGPGDGGFHFGEGSDALNGHGAGPGPGDALDDGGLDLGFDDVAEPADLGLGVGDPGVEDADFGSGLGAGEAHESLDGDHVDLDFGSPAHDDADIDDIGAF